MKNKVIFLCISMFIIVGLIGNAAAFAGAKEIKERMKNRLPQIIELKKMGAIGENNKGFVAYVGDQKPSEDIVSRENDDRLVVYQAIAKQNGTSAEVVGKRRAIQIAKAAKSGDWLQNADGEWYQK